MDMATFYMTELDVIYDNTASTRITCSESVRYSNFLEVKLPAKDCFLDTHYAKYRIYYYIESFRDDTQVQLMYIMNINAPSEFTYEADVDFRSGDEFIFQAEFD